MSTIVNKVCVGCGMDVAKQRRVKDDAGRYYCHPCFTQMRQQEATPPEDELPVFEAARQDQGDISSVTAPTSRRVGLIVAVAVGVLLLGGAGVFFLVGRGNTPTAPPSQPAVAATLTPLQQLLNAAQGGDMAAMAKLAAMYETGQGVDTNLLEARRWWQVAAAKGHPEAMFKVAMMHLTGEGADQSVPEFVRLATRAAEGGNVEAMNAMAAFYEQDGNPDRDVDKAIAWTRRAATAGDKEAAGKLSALEQKEAERKQQEGFARATQLYKDAINKAEGGDGSSALPMLIQSADLGNGDAATYAGYIYLNGTGGVQKNPVEAEKLFLRAAKTGDGTAMSALGAMYTFGLGIDKNINAGIKWYKQGTELGSPVAMSDLGYCYENGIGVPKDAKKAVELYEKAAGRGNAQAMYNLGVAYAKGTGVSADAQQSMAWYQKAAAAGHEEAKKLVAVQQPQQQAGQAEAPQAVVLRAFENGYLDPSDCTPIFARLVSTGERVDEYRLPKNISEYKVTRVIDGQVTYVKMAVKYGSARGEPRQKTITYSVEWNGQRWLISGNDFMEKYR